MRILLSFFWRVLPWMELPSPGESWVLYGDGDPFREGVTIVKILKVQSGWVLYLMMGTPYSLSMGSFIYCYWKPKDFEITGRP